MSDTDVLAYLQSHASLERFYLFRPPGGDEVLMKYLDASGRPWSIMEDDEAFAAQAVDFLKRSGVRVFNDYPALLKFENEAANRSG